MGTGPDGNKHPIVQKGRMDVTRKIAPTLRGGLVVGQYAGCKDANGFHRGTGTLPVRGACREGAQTPLSALNWQDARSPTRDRRLTDYADC